MTRVDFYFNASDKLGVARKLAAKAIQSGQSALLFTEDEGVARRLDQALWTAQALSFVPHVRCDSALAQETPLLIGANPDALNSADVIINLAPEWPSCFTRFNRLIEIVGPEDEDKRAARARYRFYQERGYALSTVDLAGRA
jgi:DNA polymerase-3 subunit chi